MPRFRLLNSVLLAAVLAVGLTFTGATATGPDVHECPPGCSGVPIVSTVS